MKLVEDLAEELYESIGEDECTIETEDNVITIYLDLPDTDNYISFVNVIERFLVKSRYDTEDFEIDGDYEGQIDIIYEGE